MRVFTAFVVLSLLVGSFFGHAQASFDGGPVQERQEIAKNIQIFPNPAMDYIHVRLESVNFNEVKVSLHNIIGNQMPFESELIDEHEIRIKVKDLDTGYYLLALKDDHAKLQGTYKFLKR